MRLSILDQSPLTARQTPGEALTSSVERAQLAEDLGYERIWYAEHRGHKAFAGNDPLALAAAALGRTSHLSVGTGGVLIGFHDPDDVAAGFTTLHQLHPGRVDAGVGRANAPHDLYTANLKRLAVRLGPTGIPVWVLGTGTRSAQTATTLGAGYAYGHFFRPGEARAALGIRSREPHNLLAVRIITGRTTGEASRAANEFLAWRARKDLGANEALPVPGTVPESDDPVMAERMQFNRPAIVTGTPDVIAEQLRALARETSVDEIMITNPNTYPEQSAWAVRKLAFELIGTHASGR